MPDLPIIPVGHRPNLSRTDRIEPQRVEPAFAIGVPSGTRGVEGATLESDRSRSVRTVPHRAGPGANRAWRGLCNRLPAGCPRAFEGVGGVGHGSPDGRRGGVRWSGGSGRTLLACFAGRHVAGGGACAGGSGPGACRDARHAPRLGGAGRRATDHRFALGFSFVRNAGRGDFRRDGTAPVPGGSGV